MRGSSKHEFLLYLINQPALLIFAEVIRPFKSVDIPGVGYVINDAELASEILMHPNFSSGGRGGMGSLITPIVGHYGLFNMDGEVHSQFKRQMLRIFNREYVNSAMQIAGGQMLADLQAQLLAGHAVDMVSFTRQFTTRIMLYMFGVDIEKIDIARVEPQITDAVEHFMSKLHLTKIALTDRELTDVFRLTKEVDTLISTNQRADQSDSLLYQLGELGLNQREAYGLIYSLLVAGTETTNVTIPRLLALLLDTEQYEKLKDRPEGLTTAIEEGIRVTTASPMIPRAIDKDTDLMGYQFKAGRRTLLIVYNMLKQSYDLNNPYAFDIERQVPAKLKHLNFGHGAHFCLGFPLAHGEIELVLRALFALPRNPRILSRAYSRGKTFPAYTHVRLELAP